MKIRRNAVLAVVFLALLGGATFLVAHGSLSRRGNAQVSRPVTVVTDPLAIVLTPPSGEGEIEKEIRSLQEKIRTQPDHDALLERLGWAFVAKARLSSDPGFYKLAEEAAKAITINSPNDPAAALLLGHIYDAEHRFAEAEKIARSLTASREFVFDYALLGDALMEQGKLGEAVDAYQKMVDLKPCLQSYSRVAYMRWLKGDLPGAVEASRRAVGAGSPRESEASAWACTRLAFYRLQAGLIDEAAKSVDLALQLAPDYAPALLMRGKLLLAQEKNEDAVGSLQQAAKISPLPEYLWTLADALRASGQANEADAVDAQLVSSGAANDPRTLALFLSSRGREPALAVRLASAELSTRQDIFTYDALAWAQFADGQHSEALDNIRRALAEGTKDARLFYHAGTIAAAAGVSNEALDYFHQAHALEQMLLPSERLALGQRSAALLGNTSQISSK